MENINIIIVEDQREVLHAITKDLTALEDFVSVEECESAAEAMDLMNKIDAQGDFVALIISDHVMPEKTGVDFLTDVHNDKRFEGTKKILLTGLATHADTINAINNASIDRYISKPWKSKELMDIVRNLLTEFIFNTGLAYEKHLPWMDKKVVFERMRKSNS
jgi:two-component system chemotaxis response regulator CheY